MPKLGVRGVRFPAGGAPGDAFRSRRCTGAGRTGLLCPPTWDGVDALLQLDTRGPRTKGLGAGLLSGNCYCSMFAAAAAALLAAMWLLISAAFLFLFLSC